MHNHSVASSSGSAKCDYEFATNQHWCKTPNSLHFIDETQELTTNYEGYFGQEELAESPVDWNHSNYSTPDPVIASASPSGIPAPTLPARIDEFNSAQRRDYDHRRKRLRFDSRASRSDISFEASPGQSGAFIPSPTSASSLQEHDLSKPLDWLRIIDQSPNSTANLVNLSPIILHNTTFDNATSPTTESLARIYLDTPVWPLREKVEAHLMRYFVEDLAPCFDLCDPARHFATVVPHRAAVCPILLNAIFACSARHLARVRGFDPYISDKYHQECLKHLIPMLRDSGFRIRVYVVNYNVSGIALHQASWGEDVPSISSRNVKITVAANKFSSPAVVALSKAGIRWWRVI